MGNRSIREITTQLSVTASALDFNYGSLRERKNENDLNDLCIERAKLLEERDQLINELCEAQVTLAQQKMDMV